jgi:hypothetical protein
MIRDDRFMFKLIEAVRQFKNSNKRRAIQALNRKSIGIIITGSNCRTAGISLKDNYIKYAEYTYYT